MQFNVITNDRGNLGRTKVQFPMEKQKLIFTISGRLEILHFEFENHRHFPIGLGTKVRLKEEHLGMPVGTEGIIIRICESGGDVETNPDHHIYLRIRAIGYDKIFEADPEAVEVVDNVYDFR